MAVVALVSILFIVQSHAFGLRALDQKGKMVNADPSLIHHNELAPVRYTADKYKKIKLQNMDILKNRAHNLPYSMFKSGKTFRQIESRIRSLAQDELDRLHNILRRMPHQPIVSDNAINIYANKKSADTKKPGDTIPWIPHYLTRIIRSYAATTLMRVHVAALSFIVIPRNKEVQLYISFAEQRFVRPAMNLPDSKLFHMKNGKREDKYGQKLTILGAVKEFLQNDKKVSYEPQRVYRLHLVYDYIEAPALGQGGWRIIRDDGHPRRTNEDFDFYFERSVHALFYPTGAN